jgi:sugar phosphate permease
MGKVAVFFFTFLTYSSLHMMRTTYSFNKSNFQKIFGLSNLLLGTLDTLLFLSLSIGVMLRYSILNSRKPVEACIGAAIPCCIGFLVIPLISLFGLYEEGNISQITKLIIIFSVILFGFCQLSFFPATLTIFSSLFNVQKNPSAVGIWSSKANVGNILGFFIANVFVANLNIRW